MLQLLLAFAAAVPTTGPSFACTSSSTAVEKTICASASLSADDRMMAKLYAEARTSAFGTGPSNELGEQRKLVAAMASCTAPAHEDTATCLKGVYRGRNNDLAIGVSVRRPDIALPVLRRTDPHYAPVIEAMVIWQSEPVGSDWRSPALAAKRSSIATLLRPAMNDIQGNEGARDMIAGHDVEAKTASIFKSEKDFAHFLSVLGPMLPGSSGPRPIPCAAIVSHPALIGATQASYGGAIDGRTFDADCEETLPPTPILTPFIDKVERSYPFCEGTIRFSLGKDLESDITAIRLGNPKHDPKTAMPKMRDITHADEDAAQTDLARYYQRYLGKSRVRAEAMAHDAILEVANEGDACE